MQLIHRGVHVLFQPTLLSQVVKTDWSADTMHNAIAKQSKIEFDYIDSTNVLTGGPEPDNYYEGTESLGQLCIQKLTEYGNYVMMVCLYMLSHIDNPLHAILWYYNIT